jgi:transposase-like protein
MSKRDDVRRRARYTLEFKLEAVRLVKAGQEASVTARVLGVPKQTLSGWVRLAEVGQLQGAGDRPVSADQMELARLRAELARVKMERDILKKATAYFAKEQGHLADLADVPGAGCQHKRLLRASRPQQQRRQASGIW